MAGDSHPGQLQELVELEALKAYAVTQTDRRQRHLKAYIKKVQQEGVQDPRFPGKRSFFVDYVRKHRVPGRRYSIGPSISSARATLAALARLSSILTRLSGETLMLEERSGGAPCEQP
jgi:hypothetical protein